jgi:hypothetical protein
MALQEQVSSDGVLPCSGMSSPSRPVDEHNIMALQEHVCGDDVLLPGPATSTARVPPFIGLGSMANGSSQLCIL